MCGRIDQELHSYTQVFRIFEDDWVACMNNEVKSYNISFLDTEILYKRPLEWPRRLPVTSHSKAIILTSRQWYDVSITIGSVVVLIDWPVKSQKPLWLVG